MNINNDNNNWYFHSDDDQEKMDCGTPSPVHVLNWTIRSAGLYWNVHLIDWINTRVKRRQLNGPVVVCRHAIRRSL